MRLHPATKGARRLLLAGTAALLLACSGAAQEDQADGTLNVRLEPVVTGLISPLTLHAPADDDRLFVIEQTGQVHIIQDGELLDELFLDLSDRMAELSADYDERGLLGLAFHPDYADNGRFFVHYSAPLREGAPDDWNHTAHVSEFTVSDDPNRADADSERIIMQIDQPQMNHDGGQLAFGPDGYLYIALGDGGAANDVAMGHPPLGNGQDVSTILGSLLRIDVDGEEPYGIPEDNPLVGVELDPEAGYEGSEAQPEIYLWGLRNPYRFSFDRETGAIWIPDVGQNLFEEVNVVTGPGNLGWNLKEGFHAFDPDNPGEIPDFEPATTGPMGEELIDPVFEYTRESVNPDDFIGITVIAGHVYRGEEFPELQGHYIFGDWGQSFTEASGTFIVAEPVMEGDQVTGLELVHVERLDEFIMGFGEGADGEVYVLTSAVTGPTGSTGTVYRVVLD